MAEHYGGEYGVFEQTRLAKVAEAMHGQTEALARLCENLVDYSHYLRVRYFVVGLLAWLMAHILRTATVLAAEPLLLFDFVGDKDGPIRSQSRTCYARSRERVRGAYVDLASAGHFSEDPVEGGVFVRKNRENENDFKFLEQHFGDLALRMGYAQPRASRVPQKHFEFQPDTLRALMLSILDHDAGRAITFDEVCGELLATWRIVVGGGAGRLGNAASTRVLRFRRVRFAGERSGVCGKAEGAQSSRGAVRRSGVVLKGRGGGALSQEKYMARAAALQVAAAVRKGAHLFCEELPPMDMEHFLRALVEQGVDASGASLALVGYGMTGTDLRERMAALGLAVGHVTADLHVAAKWRNDPKLHSNIVALARGRHPGVKHSGALSAR